MIRYVRLVIIHSHTRSVDNIKDFQIKIPRLNGIRNIIFDNKRWNNHSNVSFYEQNCKARLNIGRSQYMHCHRHIRA